MAAKTKQAGRKPASNPIVERLNASPTSANWAAFSRALKRSRAKYYRAFYPKRLKGKEDLTTAHISIYDSAYKEMYRIPVFVRDKGLFEGATIHLKGLLLNRKVG
ncbi:MAG: hypothetical protein KGH98_03755 [Candidatus Micrarchaeota archaeon]|nr:hypothetical protein [Candidatus Micrarchaeota archaeon]